MKNNSYKTSILEEGGGKDGIWIFYFEDHIPGIFLTKQVV